MALPLAVASGFVLALLSPLVLRLGSRMALAAFLGLPIALVVLLVALAPGVLTGTAVRFEMAWIPQLAVELAFSLDGLSLLFALLICGIGAVVILYAERYLAGNPQLGRFQAMLLAFMASMLGLVLADNLLLTAVFWGLTGITSFLLIGFDHEIGTSRLSAQQALIVTVAGELAMLAGLVLLGFTAGSFTLSVLPESAAVLAADSNYALIVVLILAGALSKSAQFPFHFWLPNAMAAPSPVSAYLHSATMVTAGVYLVARLTPALGGSELWRGLLIVAGALTMLIGAGLSLRQHDLKLVLAYSTVAALGTMVLLVGLGTPESLVAAMALLLAHALYKAGLFLVTGIIDHETGTRELDRLAGLRRLLPITAAAAALGALSMAGIPPLVGFAAKELGLKAASEGPDQAVAIVIVAALVVAGIATVAAAGLAGLAPFAGPLRVPREGVHEPAWPMWLGPLALGAIGLMAGLVPALGSGALVAAAGEAISGEAAKSGVQPWYGLDLVLLLSVVSILGGAVLWLRRRTVRTALARLDVGHRVGPEKGYVALERAMLAFSRWSTARLQNGRLRFYLLVVVSTLVAFTWLIVAFSGAIPVITLDLDVDIIGLSVAAIISAGALTAARSRSRLGAVTALALVGYGIALVYVLYSAPDLALAQILVETLTVLLFVLVFYHMPRFGADATRASRVRDAAIATAGGALLTFFILIAVSAPGDPISTFFMENTQPLAKGRNVVNTIIVDFRALDTLAEVTVLAVAAFGVLALLKARARSRQGRQR